MELSFVTQHIPSIGGQLRREPEDFRVKEIPLYSATGEGDHLYITFEKRSLTTQQAVMTLARALECNPREASWAGLKDRHAVTTQTASFLFGDPNRALALGDSLEGIRVLDARRHRNKLRTGHLKGNEFEITVRDCSPEALARVPSVLEGLQTAGGVPNYYGTQRFGHDGANINRAREWLCNNGRSPRDPFARKMLVSALQSAVFNRVVAQRVQSGKLASYIQGEVAVRHPLDHAFVIPEAQAAVDYASGQASPAGPMPGPEMLAATGEALAIETTAMLEQGVTDATWTRAGKLARGTRRSVRICLTDLQYDIEGTALRLRFSLPAGAYATAVLREFRKSDEDGELVESRATNANRDLHPDSMRGIEASEHTAEETFEPE